MESWASEAPAQMRADSLEAVAYMRRAYQEQRRSATPTDYHDAHNPHNPNSRNLANIAQASYYLDGYYDDDDDDDRTDSNSQPVASTSPSPSPEPERNPNNSTSGLQSSSHERQTPWAYTAQLQQQQQPKTSRIAMCSLNRYRSPSASQGRLQVVAYEDLDIPASESQLGSEEGEEGLLGSVEELPLDMGGKGVTFFTPSESRATASAGILPPSQRKAMTTTRQAKEADLLDPNLSFTLQKAAQLERQATMKEAKAEAAMALTSSQNPVALTDSQQLQFYEALQLCVRALDELDAARQQNCEQVDRNSCESDMMSSFTTVNEMLSSAMRKVMLHCEALKNVLLAARSPLLVLAAEEMEAEHSAGLGDALEELAALRNGKEVKSAPTITAAAGPKRMPDRVVSPKEPKALKLVTTPSGTETNNIFVLPRVQPVQPVQRVVAAKVPPTTVKSSAALVEVRQPPRNHLLYNSKAAAQWHIEAAGSEAASRRRKYLIMAERKRAMAKAPLLVDALNNCACLPPNVEKSNFMRLLRVPFENPFSPPCLRLPRGVRGFSLGNIHQEVEAITTNSNADPPSSATKSVFCAGGLSSPPGPPETRFRAAITASDECTYEAFNGHHQDPTCIDLSRTHSSAVASRSSSSDILAKTSKPSTTTTTTKAALALSYRAPSTSPTPGKERRSTSSTLKREGKAVAADGGDYLLRIKHQLEIQKLAAELASKPKRSGPQPPTSNATSLDSRRPSPNARRSNSSSLLRHHASQANSAASSRTGSPTASVAYHSNAHQALVSHKQQQQHHHLQQLANGGANNSLRSIYYLQQQRLPIDNLHEIDGSHIAGNDCTTGQPASSKVATSQIQCAVAIRGHPWGGELSERPQGPANTNSAQPRRLSLSYLNPNVASKLTKPKDVDVPVHRDELRHEAIDTREAVRNAPQKKLAYTEFASKKSSNPSDVAGTRRQSPTATESGKRTKSPISPNQARKVTLGTWKPAKV